MIGCKEYFNNLKKNDLQMHIEHVDDGRYSTKGIHTITFKIESSSHIHLKGVMYVPRLKENLIFVAVLEDRGYDIVFSKGKYFMKHVATG